MVESVTFEIRNSPSDPGENGNKATAARTSMEHNESMEVRRPRKNHNCIAEMNAQVCQLWIVSTPCGAVMGRALHMIGGIRVLFKLLK